MALYSYRAIDNHGKASKGLQDAANLIDLELRLKHAGLDLIEARIDTGKMSLSRGKIKRPELITFFSIWNNLRVPECRCWRALRICATP